MYIITIIVLISAFTGTFATPNNESGHMFEHSASNALIKNQPEPNGLTGAFRWVHSETAETFFALLDIRNVFKTLFNGISYFIRVIANGKGIMYQRRLPDRESYDYEAIITKIIADHENEFGPLPDGYLYPTESAMESYIASHQDYLPAILTHRDVPAAQFASPEVNSTCFMRPAIYIAAAIIIAVGVFLLVRCAATLCPKTPVVDEFLLGPVEVDLNGADLSQHDVPCVETANCDSPLGAINFHGLDSEALYDAYLALELEKAEEAEMDRQAKLDVPIPEEYEPFPVPFVPKSVNKDLELKPCLQKNKPKANHREKDSRIKELAPNYHEYNVEPWVEHRLSSLMDLPQQVPSKKKLDKSNRRSIKKSMELVRDHHAFLDSCYMHVYRLKDNILKLAPLEKETRSEGRRSIGETLEAIEKCLRWLDGELMPDTKKLVEDMEQVMSRRSRIFGVSGRDDSLSFEDLVENVVQRTECLIVSRDPTALSVLLRISKIMEKMSEFAQILEYELRNPLRSIAFNDQLAICPVYTNKELQRLLMKT